MDTKVPTFLSHYQIHTTFMSSHEFSSDDLELLRTNPRVRKVSSGRVYYTNAFRAYALQRKREGYAASEIFREAGFPQRVFSPKYCKKRVEHWLHLERKARATGQRKRGRPKKVPDSHEQRLRYLEAEVSYLKAENAFLAQLRAQRAE